MLHDIHDTVCLLFQLEDLLSLDWMEGTKFVKTVLKRSRSAVSKYRLVGYLLSAGVRRLLAEDVPHQYGFYSFQHSLIALPGVASLRVFTLQDLHDFFAATTLEELGKLFEGRQACALQSFVASYLFLEDQRGV